MRISTILSREHGPNFKAHVSAACDSCKSCVCVCVRVCVVCIRLCGVCVCVCVTDSRIWVEVLAPVQGMYGIFLHRNLRGRSGLRAECSIKCHASRVHVICCASTMDALDKEINKLICSK